MRVGEIMNMKGCTKMNPKRQRFLSCLPAVFILCLCVIGVVALEKVIAKEALSEAEAYYIVRKGDTLWAITDHFYQDPYLWPVVWGYNPHIANPHWIYPGDPIYLASIAGAFLADVVPEPQVEPVRAEPSAVPQVSTLYISRRIADTALLTPEEIGGAGSVVAARENRVLLAQGDEIFIQLPESADPSYKGPYQILRGLRKIKHPKTGERMGTLYGIMGYAKLTGTPQDSVARARILASQHAIEAGDIVRRGAPPPKEVVSNPSKRDLEGWIVAALRSDHLFSEYDVCFIDMGVEEGVEIGDTFWVMEPTRKVKNPTGPGKITLPDSRMAVLVVIHTEKKASTALVTNSLAGLEAGYRVRSRTQ
jgi:hypothetical protein